MSCSDYMSIRRNHTSCNLLISHWFPEKKQCQRVTGLNMVSKEIKTGIILEKCKRKRENGCNLALILFIQKTYSTRLTTSVLTKNCNSNSVPWHCWLGGRKGIRPLKTPGAGVVYLSGARCRLAWPSRCHCHSLSLVLVKFRFFLPFWYQYRLNWVVPERAVKRVLLLNKTGDTQTWNVWFCLAMDSSREQQQSRMLPCCW